MSGWNPNVISTVPRHWWMMYWARTWVPLHCTDLLGSIKVFWEQIGLFKISFLWWVFYIQSIRFSHQTYTSQTLRLNSDCFFPFESKFDWGVCPNSLLWACPDRKLTDCPHCWGLGQVSVWNVHFSLNQLWSACLGSGFTSTFSHLDKTRKEHACIGVE